MAFVISIMSAIYIFLSIAIGAQGDKPPEPTVIDYTKTNGRIYLDAAIDKDQNIHLIWMSIKPFQHHQTIEQTSPLYYQKGEKLGKAWSKPIAFLTNEEYPLDRQYPRVIAVGDDVEVFWSNNGLHSRLSTNGGETWGRDGLSFPDLVGSKYCVIAQSDTLYIVFSSIDSAFFSKSTDLGATPGRHWTRLALQ